MRGPWVFGPAAGLAAGVVLVFQGLSPTGQGSVDAVLLVVAAATLTWVGVSAPWWLAAIASGIAMAGADRLSTLIVAVVGLLAASLVGARAPTGLPAELIAAVSVGAIIIALGGLAVPGPFGLESVLAISIALALGVAGLAVRRGRATRVAAIAAAVVVGAAVVASGALAFGASRARSSLADGEAHARRGLAALSSGDVDEARVEFESAHAAFRRAEQRFGLATQPARLVPVVAQHRRAAHDVSARAAVASEQIVESLERIDLDALRVAGGGIDLDAVDNLGTEVSALQRTLTELDATVADVNSPWLVGPVRRRLDSLGTELAERRAQGEEALAAVHELPRILGGERPMVYFVAFTTPAEARGSVGFLGNWAEITVDRGQFDMTDFGRNVDLIDRNDPLTWQIEGMPEFLARYGSVGFADGPGGTPDDELWRIVTMSPHFPATAEVIAQAYPNSGGKPIDGVIALDPAVLAALLTFTGPVEVEVDGVEVELTDRNAEEYLLVEQYVDFEGATEDRVDALELLSRTAFDRLLGDALPDPVELARTLGPLADERHLAVWLSEPAAQDVIERAGIGHALVPLDGRDGLAVAFNNGSASKIEVFLDTDIAYTRRIDPETGRLDGLVSITMTNSAPASGLPDYVVGNTVGLPRGTSRLLVSVYTAAPATHVSVDGREVESGTDSEQGWAVVDQAVVIPPGESRTLEVEVTGTLAASTAADEPVVLLPNLWQRPTFTVETDTRATP